MSIKLVQILFTQVTNQAIKILLDNLEPNLMFYTEIFGSGTIHCKMLLESNPSQILTVEPILTHRCNRLEIAYTFLKLQECYKKRHEKRPLFSCVQFKCSLYNAFPNIGSVKLCQCICVRR